MFVSLNPLKKHNLLFFLILFGLIIFFVDMVRRFDPSREIVEKFIDTDPSIAQMVGDVQKKRLLRATLVAGAEDREPYQIYVYLITGDDARVEVVIKVEGGKIKIPDIKELIER